ncbi:hypothetical protein EMCRGX_G006811 [Ephydatia muelleri]
MEKLDAKPELRHLCRLPLGDWYAVGLKLGIKDRDLEAAEKEHWGKTTNQIREMFGLWLRRDTKATYRKLIEVLLRRKETESADTLVKEIGVSYQGPPPSTPGPAIEFCSPDNIHMLQAVTRFNAQVHPLESTTAEAVLACTPLQRALSKKLDNHAFQSLLSSSSQVNKARILSISAPHAGSWISATPSTGLDLHLDSAECQVALRWWLGLDTSGDSSCPLCPDTTLDPLGHHAATCRHGGDVVARHNRLRDIFANFCRRAHLSVQVKVGYGLARDHINSRPAEILVQGWDRGKPAAFDVTVTSPLTPVSLNNASASVGAAAYAAECRKHAANDTRCQELGWMCIPLAVETYGNWGKEAQSVFSRLASLLSISQAIPKPKMLSELLPPQHVPGEVCGKGHHGKGSCPRVG